MTWLKKQLSNRPDSVFIEYETKQYTYYDINEMTQAYAKSLLGENIKYQERVILCLPSEIELVEIILACFEIGVVAVPISPMLTVNEKNKIINKVKPKLIITNWSINKSFNSITIPIIPIEEILHSSRGCATINNDYVYSLNDTAMIILTSGTSGVPKPVELTYHNFEVSCNNWNNFLTFNNFDQFLCCLPLYHIGGVCVLFRALIYGFSANLINSFEVEKVLNALLDSKITIISLVPTMLKRIIESDNGILALKSLRWILLGGGPCPEYLLDYCIKHKLNIVKVYGMSETCSGTVALKLLDEPHNKLYAGRPFPEAKIWIEKGEIHISGPMVMKKYFGENETKGTHNSHDLGRIHNDLVFVDIRRKDLIISGGENINPIEIEEAILSIKEISDAMVLGVDDDEWGQRVIAFIVSKGNISKKNINNKLKKLISSYKIPKEYINLDSIPRNEIGKINKNTLSKLYY